MSEGQTEKSERVVLEMSAFGLPRFATGKVREVFEVGSDALLLVATDRISAFDIVLHEGIPDKGRVLTALCAYWFEQTRHITPNHLLTADDDAIAARLQAEGVTLTDELRATLAGRSLLCRRTVPLLAEAVVRGYLSGSAWKEYKKASVVKGSVDLWGHSLPAGLRESEKLPRPIFTPSTKAVAGHDQPVRREDIPALLGSFADEVEARSLRLYEWAVGHAEERGILLADTKFEWGTVPSAEAKEAFDLLLIDEAFTPDSSRFWDKTLYEPGKAQPSFDKQFVRDYLLSVPDWNGQPPAPPLPPPVVSNTRAKYLTALEKITHR